MKDVYANEREGQLDFYDDYLQLPLAESPLF